jgi:hypothetical protein
MGGGAGAAGSGETTLDQEPGRYEESCDGSFGVVVDATHFLAGNDEEQGLRLYTRGAEGPPLRTLDVSDDLGLSSDDEADLEGAARVGQRVYVVGSHSRDSDGNLAEDRHRFFAMDLSGTSPNVSLSVAGFTDKLLQDLLSASNWVAPNAGIIATLDAASALDTDEDEDLAPLAGGTSIEGLALGPTASHPKRLLLGFRSPRQSSSAIVVSLLNADAAVTGAAPSFGEALLLDLGGLGIRAMAWSELHQAVLVVGGPEGEGGPFRLFSWAGTAGAAPVPVRDLTAPPSSSPEAIIVYPGTRDVEVLFDQGDHEIDDEACKDAQESDQFFSDVIVRVP